MIVGWVVGCRRAAEEGVVAVKRDAESGVVSAKHAQFAMLLNEQISEGKWENHNAATATVPLTTETRFTRQATELKGRNAKMRPRITNVG
jgi:hypothetical protein